MSTFALSCATCRTPAAVSDSYLYRCPSCGGVLEINYDLGSIPPFTRAELSSMVPGGLGRYQRLLPLRADTAFVSLGEGNTPLLTARRVGHEVGADRLLFKAEFCNPTGSFKDRPLSVGVNKAKEMGAQTVITSSSGNAGAAMAAYAAAAGLTAVVVVPEIVPAASVTQIAATGAKVVRTAGDVAAALRLVREASEKLGWINLATTYQSPYPTEGNKTVAYELAVQLGWRTPDWVVVPIGAGPLLAGIYRGFAELKAFGLVDRIPRLAGIQASGCAPIYESFRHGAAAVREWDRVTTMAKGIADPLRGYAEDGTYTLTLIRQSGGTAVAVDDAAILAARDRLRLEEGIFVEPTGAVALAGVLKMMEDGTASPNDEFVLMLTGHGLKGQFPAEPDRPVIEPTLEAMGKLLAL